MLVLRPYIVMLQSGHGLSLAFWHIDCFAEPLCSPSLAQFMLLLGKGLFPVFYSPLA